VESAVGTLSPSEETVAKLQPLASGANALALEIAVNVAGARPAAASGQRDLFSEDTSTVLISESGAVVRLAAAVVTGQLLFLTDKRNNKEMVCQVVRKRVFRPTECYVELEFTEPKPSFWGLDFPAKAATPFHLEAAQTVQSAETAAEDAPTATPAAQGQGPAEMKQEVEGLREQIQALKQEKEQAPKAEAEAALQQSAKRAEAAAAERSRVNPPAAPVAPLAAPPPPTNPPAVASAVTDGKLPEAAAVAVPATPPAPVVRMALPKTPAAQEGGAKDSQAIDPFDPLLPKPDLDFSALPAPWARNDKPSLNDLHKPRRGGTGRLRLVLLSGLLLAVALGGAWYMSWLPLPPLDEIVQMIHPANSQNVVSVTAHGPAPAAASRRVAAPKATASARNTVTAEPVAESSAQPVTGTVAPADAPNAEAAAPNTSAPALAAPLEATKPATPAASPMHAGEQEEDASAGSIRKSAAAAPPSTTAESASPEPLARDAALVPPKLLKAANPVYPPDAMRDYITGDVRVDAVVEPNGRIGAMKILGGPMPLRQAALDALKQYEYAPATQDGRAVAAHVTVTVKFWFNP
jgi:TonB family protein